MTLQAHGESVPAGAEWDTDLYRIAAEQLEKTLTGGKPEAAELYAPVELITRESLGVSCPG